MFFNELFASLVFNGIKQVDFGPLGYKRVLEFDGMVIWPRGWQFCGDFSENTSSYSLKAVEKVTSSLVAP